MRIARRLARVGAAPSRRAAEALVEAGRVSVNGTVVTSPALDVAPGDRVTVDGKPVAADPAVVAAAAAAAERVPGAAYVPHAQQYQPAVVLLYKLRGELVTRSGTDPQGRATVYDRLVAMGVVDGRTLTLKAEGGGGGGGDGEGGSPAAATASTTGSSGGGGALIPVGRLDMNSEGLLVMTTDSDLARYLQLPTSRVPRVYRLRVYGWADRVAAAVAAWRRGPVIDGVRYQPAEVAVLSQQDVTRRYGEEEETATQQQGQQQRAVPEEAGGNTAAAEGVKVKAPPAAVAAADAAAAREDAADATGADGADFGGDVNGKSKPSSSSSGASSGTRMYTWLQVTLTEGKNRELRNVAQAFGLHVNRLVRVGYGPFSLRGLGRGDALRVARVPRWLVTKAAATRREEAAAAVAAAGGGGGGSPSSRGGAAAAAGSDSDDDGAGQAASDSRRRARSSSGPRPVALQRHRPAIPAASEMRIGGGTRSTPASTAGGRGGRGSSGGGGGAARGRRCTSWEAAQPPTPRAHGGSSSGASDEPPRSGGARGSGGRTSWEG
jgi:pseudouridine synthase